MPIEYLRTLKHDELPYPETDTTNIDKLRILRAAGMVEVELPDVDAQRPVARIIAVTGLGCATLRVDAVPPDPDAPGHFPAPCRHSWSQSDVGRAFSPEPALHTRGSVPTRAGFPARQGMRK